MKQKNKIILSLGGIVTLLLITIGLSYAYFTANITGGEDSTTITVTGGRMNIYYDGGADINVEDIVPKDNPIATKTFTVTGNNTTDLEMKYKISLEVVANTFTEEALKYKLISENTDENGTVAPSTDLTDIGTGAKTIELGIGEFASPTGGNKVHTYNLELYFLNQDYNQNEDQGKEIRAYIKIENDPCAAGNCLRDLILAEGGGASAIEAKGNPNFANISPNTNEEMIGYYDDYKSYHDFSQFEGGTGPEIASGQVHAIGTNYTFNEETRKFNLVNYTLDTPISSSQIDKYLCFDMSQYEYCSFMEDHSECNYNQYEKCSEIAQIKSVSGNTVTGMGYIFAVAKYDVIDPGDTGLYAAEDEYGTSYYYRGASTHLNNNLIFGGFQWKILRINGDGSIRIVYQGTEARFNQKGKMNTIGTSAEINGNTSYSWNEILVGGEEVGYWTERNGKDAKNVGYMYGSTVPSTQRNGSISAAATYNETDSNMKVKLEQWYETNISGKSFESKIADNLFCNDRQKQDDPAVGGPATGPGYGTSETLYAAYYRLYTNKTPTLRCGQQNDRFTKNDTTLGNGNLTYPIGLISADEASMAGLVRDVDTRTNYLGANYRYSTLSPSGMQFKASMWYISGHLHGGEHYLYKTSISSASVSEGMEIRPVLNLSSNIKVTGNGSATNPYRVA